MYCGVRLQILVLSRCSTVFVRVRIPTPGLTSKLQVYICRYPDLISPEGKMRYQASLEKKLEETKIIESGSLDMNKMWNNVTEVIIAAGEEVMGTTTMQKRNVEWFDEECREKIAKKDEARRRMLQKETRGSYEKYKELQKDVKKVCKRKKK
jgi:hypothetical protein